MGTYETEPSLAGIIHDSQARLSALERTDATVAARVIRSGSAQTIPGDAGGSTFTKVAFNAVTYDFGGMATDPDDLTAPTDGIYVAVTTFQLANVADGKSVAGRLNGVGGADDRRSAAAGAAITLTSVGRIVKGATINVTVNHTDTVNTVNLAAGASLAVFRLGRR